MEYAFNRLDENTLVKREIPLNDENIINFIRKYQKVATQEVAILFDINRKIAIDYLINLEGKNHIKSIKAGNDFFWEIMH